MVLISQKQQNSLSVKGVLRAKCAGNHSNQWKKSVQVRNSTDDYSHCCSVYFMKHKSEVLEKFKDFETGSSGQRIRKLRTDNGGEYVSKEFVADMKSKGIFHELSIPHSPEQNGVADTLMESCYHMLDSPIDFGRRPTAVYVRNCIPIAAIKEDKTPYNVVYIEKNQMSVI